MVTLTSPQNNSRVPSQGVFSSTGSNLIYPVDLTASNRNMYMLLTLNTFKGFSVQSAPHLNQYQQIALPVPVKMNDMTTINWEQSSMTQVGASVLQSILTAVPGGRRISQIIGQDAQAASQVAQYLSGKTFNPFLVMLFKTQNFKEHVLQWIFAPNNQQDTDTLHNIIEYLKAASLPSKEYVGNVLGFSGVPAVLDYPDILQVSFNVPINSNGNQQPYLYNFKPCAITSVFVDWAAGGIPSFFENGAPAIVSIVLQLKEIELWFKTGPGSYA